MRTHEHGPVNHVPYVEAVRRCLAGRDIQVGAVDASQSDGFRTAEMLVQAQDAGPFPGEDARSATVTWDEGNGWSMAERRGQEPAGMLGPVYKGMDVVPDPEDVAVWVEVLLSHPGVTPSREDHPLRDFTSDDPAFEEQLSRYSATT